MSQGEQVARGRTDIEERSEWVLGECGQFGAHGVNRLFAVLVGSVGFGAVSGG